MTGNANVQDKATTEPTSQTEMTEPKVDSDEEFQDNVMDPEPDKDIDGELQDNIMDPEPGNDTSEEDQDKPMDAKPDNDNEEHTRTKKRLFVCCDGTWQNAASREGYSTNVARFARCVDRLEPDGYERPLKDGKTIPDHVMQVVWYTGGVGTYASLLSESMWSGFSGAGVTSTILNAYYFLSSNYNFAWHEDEIILVGYSRGAFTVRCLAAFISEVGLLRRVALPFLSLLFQLWLNGKDKELKTLTARLTPPKNPNRKVDEALLTPVDIKVLAEFDPVSAMVDPFQWFRNKNGGIASVKDQVPSKVENAFLAMALNEKRSEFEPMLWKKKSSKQVVRQCAFLGCHGDIGGGNADSGLSQLPLLWMVSQVRQATINENGSQARFDKNLLLQFATPSAVGYPKDITQMASTNLFETLSSTVVNKLTSARDGPSLFETFSSTKGEITESITRRWKLWYFFKRILTLGYGQGGHDRILNMDPSGSSTAVTAQDDPNEEDQNEEDQNEEEQYEDVDLNIHFSVHMLHNERGQRQEASEAEGTFVYDLGPLKGYDRVLRPSIDDHAGTEGQKGFAWERNSSASTENNMGHCFEEQAPGEIEERLLRGWVKRAEQWWKRSSQYKGSAIPSEESLEDTDEKTLEETDIWLEFIEKWDSDIDLESNKKQTLVYFFKDRLDRDELFQTFSLGSTSSAASLVAEAAGIGEEEATMANEG